MTLLVDIVSGIATCTGFILLLGPAPDARRMLQERSTGVTPLVPLAAMHTCGWLWSIYGLLNSDIFPLMVTNIMVVLATACYIAIYYRFTLDRPYAHKVLAGFGFAIVCVIVYAALGYSGHTGQSRDAVKNVLGYIGNVVTFVFFVAPFENVVQVFRHRSGVFIPINIVAANLLNGTAWLTYSALVGDWLILVPNIGALVIGGTQAIVWLCFYPKTHPPINMPLASPDLEAARPDADAIALKAYVAVKSPQGPARV